MNKKKITPTVIFLVMALLLLSLSCESAANFPGLMSSPTPTVTNTPIPTLTPTKAPSPTPLPTGVQFESLPNGDTRVIDYDGGFLFTLSKNWTALPADAEVIGKIADKLKAENPELAKALLSIKYMGSDAFRVLAVSNSRDTYENGNFANLNVISYKDHFSSSIDLGLLVEANVNQLPSQLPSARVLSSGVEKTANDIPYGYIDVELNGTVNGRKIDVYEKIILIQIGEYINFFTFAAPHSRQQVFVPQLREILDTFQLLNVFLSGQS